MEAVAIVIVSEGSTVIFFRGWEESVVLVRLTVSVPASFGACLEAKWQPRLKRV